MSRYEAGETLASIARTYDCSPPAISYVVNRSRARHPGAPPLAPSAIETHAQLIKHVPAETTSGNAAPLGTAAAGVAPASGAGERESPEDARASHAGNGAAGNGAGERNPGFRGLPPRAETPAPRPSAAPINGEARRTLHLALGQGSSGNGAHPAEPPAADRVHHAAPAPRLAEPPHDRLPPSEPRGESERAAADRDTGNGNARGDSPARDGGGAFIDRDLRTRVEGDIAAFLAAFDAALLADTQQSRAALREATDRLLRAGARTRIELERLEARMPLPAREPGGRGEPAWRPR